MIMMIKMCEILKLYWGQDRIDLRLRFTTNLYNKIIGGGNEKMKNSIEAIAEKHSVLNFR